MAILLLQSGDPKWFIPAGGPTSIFGSPDTDTVAIESGADVSLAAGFSTGNDEIFIQGDSTDFQISRTGSVVAFTAADNSRILIPAGKTGQSLVFGNGSATLQIVNSAVMLGNQTVTTSLAAISAASLNTSETSDSQFIHDSSFSDFSLEASSSTVNEGGSVTYTVSSAENVGSDTVFTYSINSSQTLPSDFSGLTFGSVTMHSGQKTASFIISTAENDGTEENEAFTVLLMDSSGTVVINSAVTTIVDSSSSSDPYELAAAKSVKINTVGTLADTDDMIVQALDSGYQWPSTALTYSFNTSIPAEYQSDPELTANWKPLSALQQSIADDVFEYLQNITELVVTKTTNGDIRFNAVDMEEGVLGFAYYPSGSTLGGDVFISNICGSEYDQQPGDSGYSVFWHETGHALGLKHPFEDGVTLPVSEDDTIHTVMSYTDGPVYIMEFTYEWTSGNSYSVGSQTREAATPSSYCLYDVAALQAIYGADMTTGTGNDTYTVSYSDHEYKVIWDAGGTDTIDAGSAVFSCCIDLDQGSFSGIDIHTIEDQKAEAISMYAEAGITGVETFIDNSYNNAEAQDILFYTGENNLAIGFGVIIENATTGTGDDTVTDNSVDNIISTGAGNDVIKLSGGGFDTIDGGQDTDTVELPVKKADISIYQTSDSYIIIGDTFAVELTGVENLKYSDGTVNPLTA